MRHHQQRPERVLLLLRCFPGLGRVSGRPAPADTGGFGYTIKAPPGRAVAFEPAGPDAEVPAGAVATAAPPGSCPDCGTVNAPELRFCRRCGYQLFTADPDRPRPTTTAARPKRPWWQRWIPRRWLPDSELLGAEARRAFRRSLPMGLRVRRWAYLGGTLGLIVGLLYLTGANPVSWTKDRIADIKGSVVEVQGVQAASEPAAEQLPVYPADQALDRLATAWASQWRPPGRRTNISGRTSTDRRPSSSPSPTAVVVRSR